MLPPFLLLFFRLPVDDAVVVLLDGTVASVVLAAAAAAPSCLGLLGIARSVGGMGQITSQTFANVR